MWNFENRIIFITGSVRRIGLEMAIAAAKKGAISVLHYRSSEEDARRAHEKLKVIQPKTILVQGDHSIADDRKKMIESIDQTFGKLDVLINSASVFPEIPFDETDEDDFDKILNANLRGPFFLTRDCLPLLRKSDAAQVINIVDAMNNRPSKNFSAYFASKGALETLTLGLAKELAPDIQVNGIAPGPVLEPNNISDERRERILSRLPLKRWGSAEAVVQAVMSTLENDFMTGTIVKVDGGRSIS